MMGWVFAIVITASVGSFVQDLFLPKFLRRAEDTPKKAKGRREAAFLFAR